MAAHTGEGRHLVVGLDTNLARVPASVAPGEPDARRVACFNREIVEATKDLVCAYKPNSAFYEALGREGFEALSQTVAAIKELAPDVPVILDAKRADIGSTNAGYVVTAFDQLKVDAITVHPYLGHQAMEPFLEREEKLIFVLCRTSNPGAGEFQDLSIDGLPLYRAVARSVAGTWNQAGNCGLVVGATYPEELRLVRTDTPPDLPILIPGVGTQGGDVDEVVRIHREIGSEAFLINASRSILYASSEPDFAAAARREATDLSTTIRAAG